MIKEVKRKIIAGVCLVLMLCSFFSGVIPKTVFASEIEDVEEILEDEKKTKISVEFSDDPEDLRIADGHAYIRNVRVATITVMEEDSAFDEEAITDCIHIQVLDGSGNPILGEDGAVFDTRQMISEWTTPESGFHTATVTFEKDANYTWSIQVGEDGYTNKEGNFCDEIESKPEEYPFAFTVDTEKPSATVSVDHHDGIWDRLLTVITFGLYKKESIEVYTAAEDITSPVRLSFYIREYDQEEKECTVPMTEEELEQVTFTELEEDQGSFSVDTDQQFVVYVKAADYAGNVTYVCSDGDILDTKGSEITFCVDSADKNGIYNKNVDVQICVEDPFPCSGIKSVTYEVFCDGKVTQSETVLFQADENSTFFSNRQEKKEFSVTVPAEWNNSCNTEMKVSALDNAGNKSVRTLPLDIDLTPPKISVTYDNNKVNRTVCGRGYFRETRTATVEIAERPNHFDEAEATESLKKAITALDGNGQQVQLDKDAMISGWTISEGDTSDETVHTATVTFSENANYTFQPYYSDMAGNVNYPAVYDEISVTPETFTIDRDAPMGQITAKAEEWEKTWTQKSNQLTFGLWSADRISVTGSAGDATSPVEQIQYYRTDSSEALTETQLQDVKEWQIFNGLTVTPNEQFTVYLRLEDYAGNVNFISTDGMIADNESPREEMLAPEVKISPQQPVNGIYRTDVDVDISVSDPVSGNTYSGLKRIRYEVQNMGKITQSGDLYVFADTSPKRDELLQTWTGKVRVDRNLNNSNDVRIFVYAQDNAGNISENYLDMKIDITPPQIEVSYDNNLPDSEKYYRQSRVATVMVTERNFRPEDVSFAITNTDGIVPEISEWQTIPGSGNGDNIRHIATIIYEADGDYTFSVSCVDLAGNICPGTVYSKGTKNPTEFSIDKTEPVTSVNYDNNSAENGMYFNAFRTATVTIHEHNFDEKRVVFTQTAELDGTPVAIPVESWSHQGDLHTAVIEFNRDGDYTIEVSVTDLAGNQGKEADYGNSVAAKAFIIDTAIEKPIVEGLENGKAYKNDIRIAISFDDVNFDQNDITLLRTHLVQEEGKVTAKKEENVTEELLRNPALSEHGFSCTDNVIDKIPENDGIYTLIVQVSDKAGNTEKEKIVFTVNRFGSVYDINDYLLETLQNAYVRKVDQDIVITEYNASQLEAGSLKFHITRDGTPIGEVKVDPEPVINDQVSVGESGWYQYEYVIAADNFNTQDGEPIDGVYKMSVSSRDKAGNEPETSNYEEYDFLFRVDSTKPEFTSITGLEEPVVNAVGQKVTLEAFDTIGLDKVQVYLNGNLIETFYCGDDLTSVSGAFTIPEGSRQKISFVATDLAGNVMSTEDEDFKPGYVYHHVITVSTDFLVRMLADKLLFGESIAAAAVLIAGALLTKRLFFRNKEKRRKT